MSAWFKKAFGRDYLVVYAHHDAAAARRDVEGLAATVPLAHGDRILDLCCGAGRHLIELRRRGHRVTGLDLSAQLLAVARRGDRQAPLARGDMRQLPFRDGSFDVVLSLFTSYGYFESDSDNHQVLTEIARVLQPAGRFLLDYLHRDHVLRHMVPRSLRRRGHTTIAEERRLTRGGDRIEKRVSIHERGRPGATRVFLESVKLYSPEELVLLLGDAGLRVERILGDPGGAPFDRDSGRVLLQGHRVT